MDGGWRNIIQTEARSTLVEPLRRLECIVVSQGVKTVTSCVCTHMNVALAGVFSVTFEWRILVQIPVCIPNPGLYIIKQSVMFEIDIFNLQCFSPWCDLLYCWQGRRGWGNINLRSTFILEKHHKHFFQAYITDNKYQIIHYLYGERQLVKLHVKNNMMLKTFRSSMQNTCQIILRHGKTI